MPPPVVLHVAQPTEAGVARCVASYARDQRDRGWLVQVACPPAGTLVDDLRGEDIPVLEWPASRSPTPATAGEVRRLHRIIEVADPDVVHLHSSKAGLAGRLAIRGRRPTLFQPHGWSFAAADAGVQRALSVRWERIGARWAHRVVCVSEQERLDGEACGVAARWQVIPNGVDLRSFTPAGPAARAEARRVLGLAPDDAIAVTVGRLVEAKGQRFLAEAWRLVTRVVPAATLVVVGDGPDRSVLEARAVPGLRLVGEHDDVGRFLAAADVFVQPSTSEAMSLALLEAMASGLSVVATDVGGAREAVVEGAGEIVATGDTRRLADALVARLSDTARCRREGQVARQVAVSRFDERRSTEGIAALTLDLLAG